jgi:hypothetical protein
LLIRPQQQKEKATQTLFIKLTFFHDIANLFYLVNFEWRPVSNRIFPFVNYLDFSYITACFMSVSEQEFQSVRFRLERLINRNTITRSDTADKI